MRHLESLREHYALHVAPLGAQPRSEWDDAVREAGAGRARVWRLYMAAAAVGFEPDDNQVHQILGDATIDGESGFPLRPSFT